MSRVLSGVRVQRCPICSTPVLRSFEASGSRWLVCRACAFVFLPEPLSLEDAHVLYGDAYFTGGGAGYEDYVSEGLLLRTRGRTYGRLLHAHGVGPKLLDVGAAAGYIVAGFADAGCDVVGIEPNASMAAHAHDVVGVDVRVGMAERATAAAPFDAVAMIQVIAHFADLELAMSSLAEITKPSGAWLIETWNCESATARALGKLWHEYSPPTVRRIFSPRALDRLAARFGFRRVAFGRPSRQITAAHARALLAYKARTFPPLGVAAALLGRLPPLTRLPYASEDLFWALYRRDAAVASAPPERCDDAIAAQA